MILFEKRKRDRTDSRGNRSGVPPFSPPGRVEYKSLGDVWGSQFAKIAYPRKSFPFLPIVPIPSLAPACPPTFLLACLPA